MRPSPTPRGLATFLTLSLFISAFSSCDSLTTPSSPAVLELDALVADLADAACGWQTRCCTPLELEAGGSFSTRDECLSHATLELRKAAASLRFGMAEGTISLDHDDAIACVADQGARACNRPRELVIGRTNSALSLGPWLQGCLYAFRGKVTAGGRCATPAECIKGTHCATVATAVSPATADGGGTGSDAVCLTDQKRGDACQSDDDCDATKRDYCRHPDLHCAARAVEGAKCGTVVQGDQFGISTPIPSPACDDGLFCNGNPGVCHTLPKDGDECQMFGGTTCDPDPALGLTCIDGDFNGLGECMASGKEGDACGTPGLPPCKGGLTCNPGQRGVGACGPPPKAGEHCSQDLGCESPARCSFGTGLCTAPGARAAGEPCNNDNDCASLTCSNPGNGTCVGVQPMVIICSNPTVNIGAIGNAFPTDGGIPPSRDGDVVRDVGVFDVPVPSTDAPVIIFDASVGEPSSNDAPGPTDGGALLGD